MTENFNSQMTVQRRELTGVLGAEEDEEAEVLGRAMVYRAGEVRVPRDWLLSRCRDLGIPDRILPSETTPHSAYKRAMDRLVTSNVQNGGKRTDRRYVELSTFDQPLLVELDLKDGDGNVRHLTADIFFPEEVLGHEGGKWNHHDLGYFDYDTDTQSVYYSQDDDCPTGLDSLWGEMVYRAENLHDEMKDSHTGQDLRNMVYMNMVLNSPPEWPDVIPLIDRGGLYFVPEGPLTDVIEHLATIFREANDQYKVGGAEMAIRTLEVVDSDEKREWIRQRVEQSLEKMVDDVLDEAYSELSEGETVEQVVETVAERFGEEQHSAEQYNDLLKAQLDVESMLQRRAEEAEDDDKQELIESAMDEVDL